MPAVFDLQGHRGARGLKPENTLPSFEAALDLGVTTVETDIHLTRDGVPVLFHDAVVSDRLCRPVPGSGAPDPASRPAIAALDLRQLRGFRADRNPDPERFPGQDASVPPLSHLFAGQRGIDPYSPPTLAELFAFTDAYAGDLGKRAGKTNGQRAKAQKLRFDLELKRVPFRPERIGDYFDGTAPGLLEQAVVRTVRTAGLLDRTSLRSFDHRSVRALRRLEPSLATAVLITGTAPISPIDLARQAGAGTYCPGFDFLDELQVKQAHAEGIRVVPWTVNEPADWVRLLYWGVDGITTDYPDRLAALLVDRGVEF
jgi:glycerophosphoryl diester phosphodiesterase